MVFSVRLWPCALRREKFRLEGDVAFLTVSWVEEMDLDTFSFQVSRPGHFKGLRTGDASHLPVPLAFGSGPGGPPSRNPLKRRRPPASHSRKRIKAHLWVETIFSP